MKMKFNSLLLFVQKCDDLKNRTFPMSALVIPDNCALEHISRNAQQTGYINCFIVAVGGTHNQQQQQQQQQTH
jgi:hypothetical protein